MTPIHSIYIGLALAAGPVFGQNARAPEEIPAAVAEAAGELAKQARVKADFMAISAALATYRLNAGHFPTTAQGLQALIERPTKGPVPRNWVKIMAKHPVDPWGNPYGYLVREKEGKEQRLLISMGPDQDSAKDDIKRIIDLPEPEPAKEAEKQSISK